MAELTFLQELMLIRQANQKSVIYSAVGTFLKRINFQSYVCNRCHDLVRMSMNLSDIAVLKIRGTDYHCIISGI